MCRQLVALSSNLNSMGGGINLLCGFTSPFTDGIPPDGKSKEVIHTYKTGLVVFIDILATFGIIFALVCLVFNVVFRNTR